jgi:hypothetical protein
MKTSALLSVYAHLAFQAAFDGASDRQGDSHARGRADSFRTSRGDLVAESCLKAGADDVGFVEIECAARAQERPHIERTFPHTRRLIGLVLRMNRDNVRSPTRSVANVEFHHTGDEVNEAARRITAALERVGVRALNPIPGRRPKSVVGRATGSHPAAGKSEMAARARSLSGRRHRPARGQRACQRLPRQGPSPGMQGGFSFVWKAERISSQLEAVD